MAAPDLRQRLIDLFLVDAVFLQHLGRVPLGLHDGGDEQVLGADEVVLKPVCFILGVLQQPGGPGRGVDLGRVAGHLGSGLQRLVQLGRHGVYRSADLGKDLSGNPVLQL